MILFFDRNMGRDVPMALRRLGLQVEWHARHFVHDTLDDLWLEQVGQQEWTVVTHDTHFVHNESEKRAIIDHRVRCFVLAGGGADKWSKVRILARAWDKIKSIATTERPPFIYRVYSNGRLRREGLS